MGLEPMLEGFAVPRIAGYATRQLRLLVSARSTSVDVDSPMSCALTTTGGRASDRHPELVRVLVEKGLEPLLLKEQAEPRPAMSTVPSLYRRESTRPLAWGRGSPTAPTGESPQGPSRISGSPCLSYAEIPPSLRVAEFGVRGPGRAGGHELESIASVTGDPP